MNTVKNHTKNDAALQTKRRQATYLEVSGKLEEKVRNGFYPPGSRLPPQRELAVERFQAECERLVQQLQ